MSTTGHETVHNSDNPEHEQPSLFDMPAENAATNPEAGPANTPHSGTLPVEDGGERPPVDAVSLPPKAGEEDIHEITQSLPDHPGKLAKELHKPNNKKRGLIAAGTAFALLAAGFVGWRAIDSDSEQTTSTPVATSTPNPGNSSANVPASSPVATETATASPSATSAETTSPTQESTTSTVTEADFAAKISKTRVAALEAQYPELLGYENLPDRTLSIAKDSDINKQRDLIRSVFNDPNMAGFLEDQNDPNNPDFAPWFTKDAITNADPNTSGAGIPVVAFPDFAFRWATFFWDTDHPHTITPETHNMIKMADLAPADAQKYEEYVAEQGIQIGHAKAVRSDIIGTDHLPDGRVFVNTVSLYEPGNNEPTGRVYQRWSLIMPLKGASPRAPKGADIGVTVSEHFLGNAPN